MKLIQDLLSVKAAQAAVPVTEDRERFEDVEDAMNWWMDGNGYHSFEGERGIERLEELLSDWLDYQDLEHFLTDNSGCIEKIIEFIKEHYGDKLTREMQKVADRDFMNSLVDKSEGDHDPEATQKDIPDDAEVLVNSGPFAAWLEDGNKSEVYIDFANATMLYNIKDRTFKYEHGGAVPATVLDSMRKTPQYRDLLVKLRGMHEDFDLGE